MPEPKPNELATATPYDQLLDRLERIESLAQAARTFTTRMSIQTTTPPVSSPVRFAT